MCLSNGCSAVNGCRQNESQWMLCSEWVPSEWESMDALQWMGAVRMRVWWKHHSTPVHQLTSGEDKRWNKSSIKIFLTKKWVHNNSCYSDKVHLLSSLSHQNPATYLFRAVLSCKRCLICADFSLYSVQNTFSLMQALL